MHEQSSAASESALAEERALRRVATEVALGSSLEEVLATASEAACELVGGDAARLLRFEPGGGARPVAAWGARPTPLGELYPLEGGRAAVAVARTGRPSRVDDYDALAPDDPSREALPAGSRSGIAAPVIVGGVPWGALVIHADHPCAFPRGAERRIARFAVMLGIAIAAANQRAELRRVALEQSALREIAMLVAFGASRRAIFSAAAEQAARVLGVEIASVVRCLPDGRGLVLASWSSMPAGAVEPGRRFPLAGEGPTARVAATGAPARLADLGRLTAEMRAMIPDIGYRSAMAYPISVDGETWGALSIGSTSAEPLGDEAELLLGRVADVVGLAIANAEARERLRAMASTDHLTGLPNQRAFDTRLSHDAYQAMAGGRPISLVLLDLDNFKLVNDSFGHEAGNTVLVAAADRLRRLVRQGEIVARVGGEEFAWLLPGTRGAEAEAAAERARAAISDVPFPGSGG